MTIWWDFLGPLQSLFYRFGDMTKVLRGHIWRWMLFCPLRCGVRRREGGDVEWKKECCERAQEKGQWRKGQEND